MEYEGFIEYTPMISVKGTSFKAQLGQIDGVWHIRITRGSSEIALNPLSGLDPDEITSLIQKAITLPGFSGYYANIAAAHLLKEAEKGERYTMPEPEPELPPTEARATEYRPTLLSQMGISKTSPPKSKPSETKDQPEEENDADLPNHQDRDTSNDKKKSDTLNSNVSNIDLAKSGLHDFVNLLKSSAKPVSSENIEKNCEITFPFAFSLDTFTGFLTKEYGVSSIDRFRHYFENKLIATWAVNPEEEISSTVSRIADWMNQMGFKVETEPKSGIPLLNISTFEPKQKILAGGNTKTLFHSGFSLAMCKSLVNEIATLSNLKVAYQELENSLIVEFTKPNNVEDETLHL